MTIEELKQKHPKEYRTQSIRLSGMSLAAIKKKLPAIPEDARLEVKDESYAEDEESRYILYAQWQRQETDQEHERRLCDEYQRREMADLATYERLRIKYEDVVEVQVNWLNDEAQRLKDNDQLWQKYKAEAIKRGIKIIGDEV